MEDHSRTKGQPVDELVRLRRRVAELEKSRQIEKSLRESERRYRKLIENITDTIFTVDADWNFTFISPKFEKVTGYRVQDLIWHPFCEIIADECLEAFRERFKREDTPYETDFIHRDGSRIHVELYVMPILDDNGKPTGITLVTARDLTERKQMAEELLKAQKLESIGGIAGGIAHDFNNILTAILGNLSLAKMYLETEGAADKALGRLIEAEEASIKAKSLTQRLLTFARGGAPIKKLISIANLLRDSTKFALSGSNVRCEFLIPDDLWMAEADEGQLNQVINNIVMNAGEAMLEGGIVRVRAGNVTVGTEYGLPVKPGPYLKISVEDQGTGIPQEDLPKIFDPYFTTKQKRSGLGLATSYSIVKKHGGYITAESKAGVGTTILMYLPASPKKTLVLKKETGPELKETPIPGRGRILVMDDEGLIRDLLRESLGKLGYEVTAAPDGAEIIRLYMEKTYDVVMIDLTIPGGMGGKETIQKLKELDPNVKAIVSSGYFDDPIMSEYEKYGFKGVITKPYKIHELSEVLHRAMISNP